MQQALGELRTLLERFANGMSMEVVGNAIQALYEDSKSDPELKQWFSDCDTYVRKVRRPRLVRVNAHKSLLTVGSSGGWLCVGAPMQQSGQRAARAWSRLLRWKVQGPLR